jgi:hypothetical protein
MPNVKDPDPRREVQELPALYIPDYDSFGFGYHGRDKLIHPPGHMILSYFNKIFFLHSILHLRFIPVRPTFWNPQLGSIIMKTKEVVKHDFPIHGSQISP